MRYRPWGSIDWALSLSSQKQWYFVGAIGTEERSLASWTEMHRLEVIVGELFAEIRDIDSEKYRDRNQSALEERRNVFTQAGGNLAAIQNFGLMDEHFRIDEFSKRVDLASKSVVLDITSMPKRFFFLLLKYFVFGNRVQNLLVTYTLPESYADDAPLYEDIEPWKVFPGFGENGSEPDMWIVSVGFLVESLRKYVGDNLQEKKMKILVPFPSPLQALRRSGKSVSDLEQGQFINRFEKYRVDTLDMSAAFDRIGSFDADPQSHMAFAPLGPKPTSAAMCLYALQRGCSVYYPQPTIYHPEYSKGIRKNDPSSAVYAYWVKHEGEFLYKA